jgi:hypothetical protein
MSSCAKRSRLQMMLASLSNSYWLSTWDLLGHASFLNGLEGLGLLDEMDSSSREGVPTLEFTDGNGIPDQKAFDSGLDEHRATRAQTSGAKYF